MYNSSQNNPEKPVNSLQAQHSPFQFKTASTASSLNAPPLPRNLDVCIPTIQNLFFSVPPPNYSAINYKGTSDDITYTDKNVNASLGPVSANYERELHRSFDRTSNQVSINYVENQTKGNSSSFYQSEGVKKIPTSLQSNEVWRPQNMNDRFNPQFTNNCLSRKPIAMPLPAPIFSRHNCSCNTTCSQRGKDSQFCIFSCPPPNFSKPSNVLTNPSFPPNPAHLPSQVEPLIHPLNQKEEDKKWIKTFEEINKLSANKSSASPPIKIRHVQEDLLAFCNCLIDLRKFQQKPLNEDFKTAASMERLKTLLVKIGKLKKQFRNPIYITSVINAVEHRKQKHIRQNAVKKIRKRDLALSRERWKIKEQEIDTVREKVIAKEKMQQQDDLLKKEADEILGEVRNKQDDLKNQRAVLEGLKSLRQVRLNKGQHHGFISTPEINGRFEKSMSRLTDVLDKQEKSYQLEEHVLKVMMEDNPYLIHSKSRQEMGLKFLSSQIADKKQEIMEVLFGNNCSLENINKAGESMDIVIQRRVDWDSFLCHYDHLLGSSVPVNWVVPPANPNCEWVRFQKS